MRRDPREDKNLVLMNEKPTGIKVFLEKESIEANVLVCLF